ncbi:MAG: hypothetical protein RL885_06985 [Planctomycetota bacterium]
MSQASQSSIRRTRPVSASRSGSAPAHEEPVTIERPDRLLTQILMTCAIGSLVVGGILLIGSTLSADSTAGRWVSHASSAGLTAFAAAVSGVILMALQWVLREVQYSRAHAAMLGQQNLVISRQNEELYRRLCEIRNQDKGLLLDRIYNLMESLRGESQQAAQSTTVQHALVEEIHNLVSQQGPHLARVAQGARQTQEYLERADTSLASFRASLKQIADSGGDQQVEQLQRLLGEGFQKLGEQFGTYGEKIQTIAQQLDVQALIEALKKELPDGTSTWDSIRDKLESVEANLEGLRHESSLRSSAAPSQAAPPAAPAAPKSTGSSKSKNDKPGGDGGGKAGAPKKASSQQFRNALSRLKNLREQNT